MKRLHGIYILLFCLPIYLIFNELNFIPRPIGAPIGICLLLLIIFGLIVLVSGKPISNDLKNKKVKLVFGVVSNLGMRILFFCLGIIFILSGLDLLTTEVATNSSSTSILYRFRIGLISLGTFNSSQLFWSIAAGGIILAGVFLCLYCLGLVRFPEGLARAIKGK